jgi:hypothetical protein
LVTSTCAPHRASASFAASTGWNDTGPTTNQERVSWMSVPSGVSTSTSSSTQTSIAMVLRCRTWRSGTLSATQNSTAPTHT